MQKKYKLTGEYFYKFFQCPHWLWYDLYGDQAKKGVIPPLIEMIYKRGLRHEREVIKSRSFNEVKPELFRDLDEAFSATLELMKQGKNIYHGVLMDEHWVGIPDLLETRPGKSNLGDFYYVVYDIKSGKEIKDEYKFQLVFYSLILEKIQGVRPKEAFIINSDGEERSFAINEFLDQFKLTLQTMEKILEGEKPAPFLKAGCKHSPWYSLCVEETVGCNDISLLYRISQADQKRFYQIGIHTVDDLANAELSEIESNFEDWPYEKLLRLYTQAQVLTSKEPKVLRKPDFPKVSTEIYFDVESDPTQGIDYLLGVIVKKDNKTKYTPFLTKDKDGEAAMWREFLDFLDKQDDYVIYHYSYYEREVFARLGKKYGTTKELEEKFNAHTIDLNQVVVDSVVLPLYFYSLKDIARYLGFNWRTEDAGGAESVVWYNEWLEKGDQKVMDKILEYNEDDCRATLYVKEWLENQRPHIEKEKLPEN